MNCQMSSINLQQAHLQEVFQKQLDCAQQFVFLYSNCP